MRRRFGLLIAALLPAAALAVVLQPPSLRAQMLQTQMLQAQTSGLPRLEEDFGRWEQRTRACEMRLSEPSQPSGGLACRALRLDQQLAGLLSIRFLPVASDGGRAPRQLLFAGVLQEGSRPMRCRDGRCTPRWPIRVQISAVATNSDNALGLPQAQLAQGSCRLDKGLVSCEARNSDGGEWRATARW